MNKNEPITTAQLLVAPPAPAKQWGGDILSIPEGGSVLIALNGVAYEVNIDSFGRPYLTYVEKA